MKRAAIGTVLLLATVSSFATGCYGRAGADVRVDPPRDDRGDRHDDHHDDHQDDKHDDHGH
jgi:hypothetical protein